MKKQQGFTLIEIAVVMVIVGLILGMILKGQEIITNAKIKNIESSFNSIAKAISIYQERYHALPGDDTGAKRFDATITVPSGSNANNGIINGYFDSQTDGDESRLLWLHLRHAGLVSRTFSEDMQRQPFNAFNGLTGVSSDSTKNGAKSKGDNSMPLFVGFTNIPGNVAVVLESRLDDLEEDTGRIRSNQDSYDGDNGTNAVLHNMYFSL
jgi:prepilin-type N-terminal cleavage/methylation domain-containing protein